MAAVKNSGVYTFDIDGTKVELTEGDPLISSKNKEGFAAESDGKIVVILDEHITPELRREGFVRELISKGADHAQGHRS